MTNRTTLLVFVLATGLAGCDDRPSTPAAPTAFTPPPTTAPTPLPLGPVAGNWVGVFESSNYATRSIELNLIQPGASRSVTGTWAFPGAEQGGTVSGTVDNENFIGSISYSGNHDPMCVAFFAGTASSAALNWTSPGFTGVCSLSVTTGNPVSVQLILQRP